MATTYQANWAPAARCAGTKDILFAEVTGQRRASQICQGCPVWRECLAEALDGGMQWGVWGGLTERQRRKLVRGRPDVTSWRAFLFDEPELA